MTCQCKPRKRAVRLEVTAEGLDVRHGECTPRRTATRSVAAIPGADSTARQANRRKLGEPRAKAWQRDTHGANTTVGAYVLASPVSAGYTGASSPQLGGIAYSTCVQVPLTFRIVDVAWDGSARHPPLEAAADLGLGGVDDLDRRGRGARSAHGAHQLRQPRGVGAG